MPYLIFSKLTLQEQRQQSTAHPDGSWDAILHIAFPMTTAEFDFVNRQSQIAAILILAKSCSRPGNACFVRTSERAKRARTVERTGFV
jgi:hypothetical protein